MTPCRIVIGYRRLGGNGDSFLEDSPRAVLHSLTVLTCHIDWAGLSITAIRHKYVYGLLPVPAATWSKAYVCGRSPAETVGWNPTGGMNVCLL
jgi:hypothetical protein